MEDAAIIAYGRHVAFMARAVEAALGDLSMTSYRILVLVSQGDGRSSRIAGRLAIGRPAVSYVVDTLVDKGLMTRSADEQDRRAVRLEITEAGRAVLAEADAAVAAYLRPLVDRLADPGAVRSVVADVTAAAWNDLSADPAT